MVAFLFYFASCELYYSCTSSWQSYWTSNIFYKKSIHFFHSPLDGGALYARGIPENEYSSSFRCVLLHSFQRIWRAMSHEWLSPFQLCCNIIMWCFSIWMIVYGLLFFRMFRISSLPFAGPAWNRRISTWCQPSPEMKRSTLYPASTSGSLTVLC